MEKHSGDESKSLDRSLHLLITLNTKERFMTTCSLTTTDESKQWPEGVISVKLTMNPYLLAFAEGKSMQAGVKVWEFINLALWEKFGKPTEQELLDFASSIEVDDLEPKWKKRLKLTARHELEVREALKDVDSCKGFVESHLEDNQV
jgi:hypothetical protein